ncbi:ABC transporter substrate-binding protein [Clostridium cuniculi]|uniref:ABC transporter substrate-binding protein n=1 Tax=Clostridium cuniculi TaxID=2548455 RepID=UPI001056D701|nr:ABC transporter substrate-binding protein [Clostridium cuniculi]
MSKFLKKIATIIGLVAVIGATFGGCEKTATKNGSDVELQIVRLNEVVRSVFYTPMYVAITEGFFEEEGLEIDLSTGQGADTTYFK